MCAHQRIHTLTGTIRTVSARKKTWKSSEIEKSRIRYEHQQSRALGCYEPKRYLKALEDTTINQIAEFVEYRNKTGIANEGKMIV